jgi:dTDP-4-amino-4,6-dideoxygalactose transaminase
LKFMEKMKEQGIQTSIHYPPIHQFTSFKKNGKALAQLTVTEDIASREVTLPLYPLLTDEQVELVAYAVRKAYS